MLTLSYWLEKNNENIENIYIEDIYTFSSDADLHSQDDSSLRGLQPLVVSDFFQLF